MHFESRPLLRRSFRRPRRPHANELIADLQQLRFCAEAVRTEIAPAVLHDHTPCLFRFNLIGGEVLSRAFLAERGHALDLGGASAPHNQPSWLSLVLEARQLGAMPLCLRRAADQYPSSHWEPSNDNLVILSGEIVVGSLKKQNGGRLEIGWS